MSAKKHGSVRHRRGVAATEAAIMLPLFVLTVFASIEAANAIYLKQSLTLAAYEAASILEENTGTIAQAEARCSQILGARDVQTFEMNVSPVPNSLNPGDVFTVDVSSPASAYRVGPSFFFQTSELSATISTVRQ